MSLLEGTASPTPVCQVTAVMFFHAPCDSLTCCCGFCIAPGPFLLEKEEDRVLLIKAVLHASDISNPVRPFHVNCVMSTSVHREFRSGSTSCLLC